MVAAISSPTDVINLMLRRIGYKLRVSDLWDGSEAASASLDIYAQTRDDFLRDGNWDFAQRDVLATILRAAPAGGYFDTAWDPATNPPLPWLYAYAYPDDCLKVRILKDQGGFLFNPQPMPTLYTVANVKDTVSTLASLAVNAHGTGYVPGDYIFPTGGTQTTSVILQAPTTQVVSATVAAAGSGGTPGTQTVTGTTGTGTKFQASVTVDGGGAISAVLSITVAGSYTVNPTAITQEPVTGASLAGAKLSVVMGVDTIRIVNAGVFTTTSTTFTQGSTSGSGTGVTFNTATYTSTTQPRRVICTNVENAMLTYTGQVTDLSQWPVDAIEAFCAALARRLVPTLVGMNAIQVAAQDEAVSKNLAMQEEG